MGEMMILAAGGEGGLLVPVVKVLIAAGVVALVMLRLKVAAVPAYLIAGAVLGPSAIGLIQDAEELTEIGHLSIILLMFGIGLELDLHVFRHAFKQIVVAILLALTITALLLYPLALLLGGTGISTIAVAMALTMSSTALVLRALHTARELDTARGRMCLSILVGQDIAVVPALIIIPILGTIVAGGAAAADGLEPVSGITLSETLKSTGIGVLGIAGIVVGGVFVLPRILQYAARRKATEVILVLAAAFGVGSSALTSEMGLSAELGAFLSGFLLSTTPFKHQLAGQIVTFRDLLIAVFFTTLGMELQLPVIAEHAPMILLVTVGLLVIKTFGISAGCFLSSLPLGVSLATGLTLAQSGEFSIIILQLARSESVGLVDDVTADKATAAIVLTLIATPALMALGKRIDQSPRFGFTPPWVKSRTQPAERTEKQAEGAHVVIAGFGVVGRAVADQIGEYVGSVTVIELNPGTVTRQRELGRDIIYGDASNPEVLHAAGLDHATVLVLTIADDNAAIRAVETARRIREDLTIIVRAGFMGKGLAAKSRGASEIIVEEVVTAQAMSSAVHRTLTGE